jgi:hypothetical protein
MRQATVMTSMSRRWVLLAAIVTSCILSCFGSSARAEEIDTLLHADEGPHVFWQTETDAVVFYYHDKKLQRRPYVVADKLEFDGWYEDSHLTYIMTPEWPVADTCHWTTDAPVLCLSDMHGDYFLLLDLLKGGGVIDDELHWSFGAGHLVVAGDLTDRGARVTECLWLIHRLEQEAVRMGGRVHYLLGNHELMSIRGDLRYVHERYLKGIGHRKRIKYDDLFGVDMELGRWLRTRHTVITINGVLYVHGGLSPDLMARGMTVSEINEQVRRCVGLSDPQRAIDDTAEFLFGSWGPFWYRGYHYGLEGRYPAATDLEIDAQLAYFGVSQIVVGHTNLDSVMLLRDGRIVGIDVDVEVTGHQQAALWRDGKIFRVTPDGVSPLSP